MSERAEKKGEGEDYKDRKEEGIKRNNYSISYFHSTDHINGK